MLVTRTSPFTGVSTTRELDVTHKQLYQVSHGEGLIQDILPHLSPIDREFVKTGYTQEDWDAMFPCFEEDWLEDLDNWND
jgi:hypothetical protein